MQGINVSEIYSALICLNCTYFEFCVLLKCGFNKTIPCNISKKYFLQYILQNNFYFIFIFPIENMRNVIA